MLAPGGGFEALIDIVVIILVAAGLLSVVGVAAARPSSDTFVDERLGDGAIVDDWGLEALEAREKQSWEIREPECALRLVVEPKVGPSRLVAGKCLTSQNTPSPCEVKVPTGEELRGNSNWNCCDSLPDARQADVEVVNTSVPGQRCPTLDRFDVVDDDGGDPLTVTERPRWRHDREDAEAIATRLRNECDSLPLAAARPITLAPNSPLTLKSG